MVCATVDTCGRGIHRPSGPRRCDREAGLALGVSCRRRTSWTRPGPRLEAASIAAAGNESSPATWPSRTTRQRRLSRACVRDPLDQPSVSPISPARDLDPGPYARGSRLRRDRLIVGRRAARSRASRRHRRPSSTRSRGPAVFFRSASFALSPRSSSPVATAAAARFTVQGGERCPKDEFPDRTWLRRTDGPTLRRITCGGDFYSSIGLYVDNTIVCAA